MKTFKDLKVWVKSHNLVLEIYKISKLFPAEEKFGLTSQIRRSASSIPANIVEGFKRKGQKEFAHFLNLADASLEETKYHLMLAHDLKYLVREDYERLDNLCSEIGRMIYALQKKLNS